MVFLVRWQRWFAITFPWFCLPCPFVRLSIGEGTNSSHHEKVGTEVFDSVAQAGWGQGRRSGQLPVLPRVVATEPLRTWNSLRVFKFVKNLFILDVPYMQLRNTWLNLVQSTDTYFEKTRTTLFYCSFGLLLVYLPLSPTFTGTCQVGYIYKLVKQSIAYNLSWQWIYYSFNTLLCEHYKARSMSLQ